MTTEEPGVPAETPDVPKKGKGKRRMTWKKWLAIGLAAVVVLAGVGVGTFLLLRPTNTNRGSISRDYQATVGTQTQTVSFDGTLSPAKQSNVNFTVAGTVTRVKVKAGDTVTKGQALAKIDSSSLADAVNLAEANLTTAKANLTEVYDNSGSSAAITSAKAQVTSARAALTSAKTSLDDAVLRSPVKGTVASVGIEVGDSVGASSGSNSSGSGGSSASSSSSSSSSSAAFVVIGTSTWKVEGSVGASSLSSLKAGQSVSVTTDSSTEAIKGTVSSVGIVATSTDSNGAATFPVVASLSGTHTGLYSGTTATAVITTGSYPDVLTVPTAAIATVNGQTVVKKVTNNAVAETPVEVGRVFGAYTQIKSGLSEGDTVRVTVTFASASSSGSSGGGSLFGGGGGGFGGLTGGGGQPPAGQPGSGSGGNR